MTEDRDKIETAGSGGRPELSRRVLSSLLIHGYLKYVTWEGALANVFVVLTGGAFLTGLALYWGANDFQIGLLASLPFLAQFAQIISGYLENKVGTRKKITLAGVYIGRQIWWVIVPVLFWAGNWRLEILLAVTAISGAAIMIATPEWMAWMADLIPEKVRGRYFGGRNSAIAVSTVITTLIGGLILDHFRGQKLEQYGFAIIIGISCVASLGAAWNMRNLPDQFDTRARNAFHWPQLLEPLKDRRFRPLLKALFVWNLGIGISAVFFAAHMINNLKMSFFEISIYSAIAAISGVIFNRAWGKLIDRFGSKPVVAVSAFAIALVPMIWWLPRADFVWILYFEAIYTGMVWAGFNLAAFNVPISYSPRERRTSYLAVFSVLTGAAFFLASVAGGVLAETLDSVRIPLGQQTLINYHVLFAFSSVLRFLAAMLVVAYHEPAERGSMVVLQFVGTTVLKRISMALHLFPLGGHNGNGDDAENGGREKIKP